MINRLRISIFFILIVTLSVGGEVIPVQAYKYRVASAGSYPTNHEPVVGCIRTDTVAPSQTLLDISRNLGSGLLLPLEWRSPTGYCMTRPLRIEYSDAWYNAMNRGRRSGTYGSRRGEFNEPRNVSISLTRKLTRDSLKETGLQEDYQESKADPSSE